MSAMITGRSLFVAFAFGALALGMYFVFARTRLGMMIRAGSTNREMVQSLGIDIKFLYRVVFAADRKSVV